jgi:hypothetical protein
MYGTFILIQFVLRFLHVKRCIHEEITEEKIRCKLIYYLIFRLFITAFQV